MVPAWKLASWRWSQFDRLCKWTSKLEACLSVGGNAKLLEKCYHHQGTHSCITYPIRPKIHSRLFLTNYNNIYRHSRHVLSHKRSHTIRDKGFQKSKPFSLNLASEASNFKCHYDKFKKKIGDFVDFMNFLKATCGQKWTPFQVSVPCHRAVLEGISLCHLMWHL